MFDWYLKLWEIEDTEILEKCGEEMVFYLKYLKSCAVLFFIMSLLNIPALIIYYKRSNITP